MMVGLHRRDTASRRVLLGKKGDFENDAWELYDLRNDFSQADDRASKDPAKLKEDAGSLRAGGKGQQRVPPG